ncbi:undecaprenyldiphospho-muramoylpentapeptide beta-N-acetylglucosaminyltransferase [Brevibacillus fulvus]|uniref:UDP-N-acetylglucosamine--N-acetylmuramyl-(pentapeptide) pyrophosphoryl-undecaprenol N-acetylglucosamine transferase n=1 Tax=Brevibacillus fulvus TaxID=1125967 RepID=A0A938XRY6_9BACL|nr:undecaprenyldiphospho-muramoylpentapeptide beta-N-acetylglucosaminyltransferase [Brevibacillus fulvus]MBM7588802.1 UDP-N-acetylglucosamine--N-acetylmuramyl-(pentapeptide) pyrophosphoryl-undecaprenol N-acetylglucosamine transferase [Brevibacillus fulvus]
MKRIVFTGGGSAGHVTVNLALIPHFVRAGWKVDYIGSENGIEKQLVQALPDVTYHSISTGKLRRYFDWNNFKDPFKVVKGVFQAQRLIRRLKPHVLFSKGGFVSVPVIFGGWMNKVPIIIHESDITPGLANRLSFPFATKVCVTFPETLDHFQANKALHVGAVIREEITAGNGKEGLAFCGFSASKPVLLIMGGSLGSQKINQLVRQNLQQLLERFQIVHICGKGQLDSSVQADGYRQFEYVNERLADLLAMTDLVVSRAGSNSIFEFLTLNKPMVLIPLSRQASRGDQILNAESFRKRGYAEVIEEEQLTGERFVQTVLSTYEQRAEMKAKMQRDQVANGIQSMVDLIMSCAK